MGGGDTWCRAISGSQADCQRHPNAAQSMCGQSGCLRALEWMVTSDNLYLGSTVDDLSRVLGCHPGLQSGTVLIGGAIDQHLKGGSPVCSPSSTRQANTGRRYSRRRGETGRHRAK